MNHWTLNWLGMLVLLLALGCGDTQSDSSDASSSGTGGGELSPACETVAGALEACDLEPVALECPANPNESEQCILKCLADSSCGQLRNEFCPNRQRRSRCGDMRGPQVICGNGVVVPEDFRCDGIDDCLNNADEEDCPEGSGWTCDDGVPLKQDGVCDGFPQCFDGSDEAHCSPDEIFDCGDGDYTSPLLVCDGTRDCDSGADEANCPVQVICN